MLKNTSEIDYLFDEKRIHIISLVVWFQVFKAIGHGTILCCGIFFLPFFFFANFKFAIFINSEIHIMSNYIFYQAEIAMLLLLLLLLLK